MTHPYDQSYLQEVAETQGSLFERLQDVAPTADGLEFVRSYMKSDTREIIDAIPPEWLSAAYPGLHDLDLAQAVEKVSGELAKARAW